ncbi:hypothetical protein [uncultured Polaribacter sp.]|uniref:hypothetical protein n=1 Tax=uncultured Polaribacter sp. TaxID=174711 RepID=UPI002629FD5A|nr:hypothetical protein [uncultured Polaribacter sp.]
MSFKKLLLPLFVVVFIFSCTEDTDISVPRNLEEYITSSFNNNFGEVIACAASAPESKSLSYIFYYPEVGARDIRYYEADSLNVDENDFSKYRRKNLEITDVFGGKLQRFSRTDESENWCLVTYVLNGKLHKSNPIRLKNNSKSTTWTNEVTIDFPETLEPKFTWTDIKDVDDAIYFQVISEKQTDTFVSGTYTNDTFFNYFDATNIVLNINVPETPDSLEEDIEYLFTLMGVSEDNWVNTVVEQTFIPRNLEEYLALNSTKTIEKITAFAASANNSDELTYVYYQSLIGATDFRYYETDNTAAIATDFSAYRRVNLSDNAEFGGKFRRYSRTNTEESWSVVTYVIGDKLYKSAPVKIKMNDKPTEYITITDQDDKIDFTARLEPKFIWEDEKYGDSVTYFQVITNSSNDFLSGTFTTEKTFQYNNFTNITSNINTETPAELIFDDEYRFTLMGIDSENWVNFIYQQSFIAR